MEKTEAPFILANWYVEPHLNKLTLAEQSFECSLPPKVMALLVLLTRHQNTPLSLDFIAKQIWPDRVVTDSSIYQAVAQLRKTLHQDKTITEAIEQISGKGYRLSPHIDLSFEHEAQNSLAKGSSKKQALQQAPAEKITKKHKLTAFAVCVLVFMVIVFWFMNNGSIKEELQAQVKKQPNEQTYFEDLTLADHLVKQRDVNSINKASKLYKAILNKSPNNANALFGLCNSDYQLLVYGQHSQTKTYASCLPLLQKAIEIAPHHINAIALLGALHQQNGDFETAKTYFEQGLLLEQKSSLFHLFYGDFLLSQQQTTEALTSLQTAFKLSPNDPEVLIKLAYAYLVKRDRKKAQQYFERARLIAPNLRNAPLYALDFYPLTKPIAAEYEAWYEQYSYENESDEYKNKFAHFQLQHVLFLLSTNQLKDAQTVFEQTNKQYIPNDFTFYVEAALAAKPEHLIVALEKLEQRYQLAPALNRYVIPYIHGLIANNDQQMALNLFTKHFAEFASLTTPVEQNLGLYLTYAQILQGLENKNTEHENTEISRTLAKLTQDLALWRELNGEFSGFNEVKWHVIKQDDENVKLAATKLLNSDWLPDYNDNMFTETLLNRYLKEHRKERK
ncbi:tetratricopeptide repeat protein [Pseudoalteromonas sp. SS15]|uniref:tetratricopeptide repeat protein n=1 Tax=Pseudoalteromonas sp. SS15 TaxID=3139393 RepID=UPI003BAC536D